MAGFLPGRTAPGEPELDGAEHKSWQNYLATVLRMSTLLNRELLDAHQLSLTDVQLLDLLANSPGGTVQLAELADAVALLPSRLTRHIRRLQERGLLARMMDPQDRRRVVAVITEAGKTLVEQALITYANAVRTHFLGPLTYPQIAAVATTCRHISDGLEPTGRPRRPQ